MDKMQMSEIQKRLREAIEQSGYTQTDIAQAVGVSNKTISAYITREVFPAPDTFARLCAFLDVSADEILGLTD